MRPSNRQRDNKTQRWYGFDTESEGQASGFGRVGWPRDFPLTGDSSKPPRFTVSIAETLVVAILSALCAVLLPAVNAAREIPRPGIRDAQPPVP